MSNVQQRGEEMIAENGFLGVPVSTFEVGGRLQLIRLLQAGLTPESTVLEFGCGCLRVAYWIVRFLDPDCYFGVEPAMERVELGKRYLFGPEELRTKRPRFDFNPHFNSSRFGAKFDFFIAGSIWTHASKGQIAQSLDSFVRDSTHRGIFLTSYLPAEDPADDYLGDSWVGTSHESTTPGIVRHSVPWMLEQCRIRDLDTELIEGIDCDSQYWLKISRRGHGR